MMDTIISYLGEESCLHLVEALGYTIGLGVIIGGLLAVYLSRVPAREAGRRYIASLIALGLIVLGGFVTWSVLNYEPATTIATKPLETADVGTSEMSAEGKSYSEDQFELYPGNRYQRPGRWPRW